VRWCQQSRRSAGESREQRSAQSRAELDADGEVVDGREAAVCELKKETGLAHACRHRDTESGRAPRCVACCFNSAAPVSPMHMSFMR